MKILRNIKRILLVLLIILVALVVFVGFYMDTAVKTGVEKGAEYAMGVETRVDDLNLQLFRGRLLVDSLQVANPEGYSSNPFMKLNHFDLELKPTSLLTDKVVLRNFELDGLDIRIEQKLTESNVSKLLDNLKRLDSGKEPDKVEKKKEGKKVQLDRVRVKNVVAHFHLLPGVSPGPISVKVPEIVLDDVTSDEAGGIVVEQLVARIVPAILASVLENAEGVVPKDFLNTLDRDLKATAQALGGQVESLMKQAEKNVAESLKKLGAEKLGKEATKSVGGLLKGVLNGKEEEVAPKK